MSASHPPTHTTLPIAPTHNVACIHFCLFCDRSRCSGSLILSRLLPFIIFALRLLLDLLSLLLFPLYFMLLCFALLLRFMFGFWILLFRFDLPLLLILMMPGRCATPCCTLLTHFLRCLIREFSFPAGSTPTPVNLRSE